MNKEANLKLIAAAMNRLNSIERKDSFDPVKLGSKPTIGQQEIIDDFFNTNISNLYVLGGNQSGKSLLSLRIASWIFNGEKKVPNQGDEDPFIIILSRTGKQIEESLWVKLAPCLTPGTYKCIRQGNMLQAVHSTVTGARILFNSYENEGVARERVQSYTAHLVIVDEMPRTRELLEEVQRRVNAKRGKLLTVFTPKVVSREVRDVVESAQLPYSKKYFLAMLDNPVYTEEDKLRILSELSSYSEGYRNTILYGNWMAEGNLVYYFDPDTMVKQSENYSRSWRHVECSDPALHSSHGLLVAAEDPNTGLWYVRVADYIEGISVPSNLVQEVKNRTMQFNIVRRISDTMTWYIETARTMGMNYVIPYDKNNRRDEMLTKVQESLGKRIVIEPHCVDLIDEINTYHWSEKGAGKIADSDKYHLLDALRYLIDCLPEPERKYECKDWAQELREANNLRKKIEHNKSTISSGGRVKRSITSWRR